MQIISDGIGKLKNYFVMILSSMVDDKLKDGFFFPLPTIEDSLSIFQS